jgi:hypothetical protein
MENKNKIGALVILGGIALLGYVYFKRTKPVVSTIQSQDLKKLSDSYSSGAKAQDDTKIDFKYEVAPVTNAFGFNPFMANLDFKNFPSEYKFKFTKEMYNGILQAGNPAGLDMVELAKSVEQ